MPLILASASPRRRQLLEAAGYVFEVVAAEVDESALAGEDPRTYVVRVAAEKAAAVSARHPRAVVLAADTTVVLDNDMLGKPADDEDARSMLGRLSGRTHEVLTGVVVLAERTFTDVVATRVSFRPLTGADIDWYVASGEPRDKAGAYGVQGLASWFVESVEGSFSNVMGLPVGAVRSLLDAAGTAPHDAARWACWAEPRLFDRIGG